MTLRIIKIHRWVKARESADITFQSTYLAKVLSAKYPPKAYVQLEGEDNKHFHLKWR